MSDIASRYAAARNDPGRVVLEGFHAIKHALRFGGELLELRAADREAAFALGGELAPDVLPQLQEQIQPIAAADLQRVSPRPHPTGMIAIARRPFYALGQALSRPGPAVLLEEPRHLGNLGACIRVAAAADAAALVSVGAADPWTVEAVRGAAGLQFALPVLREAQLPTTSRRLVAVDPEGDDLEASRLPKNALLAFGNERSGLSPELLERADARVRIPMRTGVSSLNLATSVAAVLFGGYDREPDSPPA